MGIELPPLANQITDQKVKDFIQKYYEVSNNADAHDDYAALFTPDGEFAMNAKKAKGTEEIRTLRKAIWAHVPDRDHKPIQIYTHGDDQYDLMVHGDVAYKHHAGHETGSDWAAKMRLAKVDGEVKVAYYQIIVDSAAHI